MIIRMSGKKAKYIWKDPVRQSKILQCRGSVCFPNLKFNLFHSRFFVPMFYEVEFYSFQLKTVLFFNIFQKICRGLSRAHSKGFCTDVGKSLKREKMFMTNPSSIFRLWQKHREYFIEDRQGTVFNKPSKIKCTKQVM